MSPNRERALAALGLAGTADADPATVQRAFERLARRYPEPHFPERFRELLNAREELLDAGRRWRNELESRTLDLSWALPHLKPVRRRAGPDRRTALQDMLRAGYRTEPLSSEFFERIPDDSPDDLPF